ncbi:hypothetical protein BGZ79_007353 [Entomortierella chlamydospora]|nr:hypothetical protein BGZ79_007353 [Entomortierella chlamydospora]
MASVTLSSPPSRSDSLTDEDEVMAHDPSKLPMSPPLSQESLLSSELILQGDHLQQQQHKQQQQQQQQQLIHPLDHSSLTAPKKTLNWVNALPSHFDTAVSGHPRKRRRRTNREELEILEDAFARNLLPDAATRQELGDRLGMSVRAVQIWFQNRRQTLRKKSISSSGVHNPGSEEDMSRSDAESAHSLCRRSSGDSAMSLSPTLNPTEAGHLLKRGSKSCSNLLSGSPPSSSTQLGSKLLRAETCSSLPTSVSAMSSTIKTPSMRSSSPIEHQIKQDISSEVAMAAAPRMVAVKTEVVEKSPRELLAAAAATTAAATTPAASGIQDILDVKTADRHLCMLLEEAKRRSGQNATPVMGIWSDTPSKPVLNPSSTGAFPTTTTFPTPKRTMSTPTMRSATSASQCRNSSSQHFRSTNLKIARKHRSMPESTISNSVMHPSSPYPRTVSLMEQVINRQQQQHHHHHQQQQFHHRPAPTNFKQSALSSAGKYSLDSICNKAMRSTPPAITANPSTALSATQLARRLQYIVRSNLKRVQSESVIHDLQKANNNGGGGRYGQTAMRARRLSFGKFLFDSDTEEESREEKSKDLRMITSSQQQQQHQQPQQRFQHSRSEVKLTHQAQKRRAGSTMSGVSSPVERAQSVDLEVDGDETDDEDFVVVAQNQRALKRFDLSKDFASTKTPPSSNSVDFKRQHQQLQQQQPQQQQLQHGRNGGVNKMPRMNLKSSLSTLSLVTSSPTREYALELERSRSPLTSCPILERNRIWNNGVTAVEQTSGPSSPTTNFSTIATAAAAAAAGGPALPSTETKDLNMDELECASVLAGLGWGR